MLRTVSPLGVTAALFAVAALAALVGLWPESGPDADVATTADYLPALTAAGLAAVAACVCWAGAAVVAAVERAAVRD